MEQTETLDLVVSEFNLGTLESNARALLETVKAKLQDYQIQNYNPDNIAEAKSDKANLNSAAERLNKQRLEYERKFMAPFEPFKALVTETCQEIKKASAAIDGLVKAVEQQEKDEKRAQIEEFFASLNCEFFPLEKIFSPAWLNKTMKLKAVQAEIIGRIETTKDDLCVLDRLGEPEAKAHYLQTLNLNAALAEVDRLKENRKRLAAAEAEAKKVIEAEPCPPEGLEEDPPDQELPLPEESEAPPPEDTSTTEEPAYVVYTLRVRGPWEKIRALRAYMDAEGITYEKL